MRGGGWSAEGKLRRDTGLWLWEGPLHLEMLGGSSEGFICPGGACGRLVRGREKLWALASQGVEGKVGKQADGKARCEAVREWTVYGVTELQQMEAMAGNGHF